MLVAREVANFQHHGPRDAMQIQIAAHRYQLAAGEFETDRLEGGGGEACGVEELRALQKLIEHGHADAARIDVDDNVGAAAVLGGIEHNGAAELVKPAPE